MWFVEYASQKMKNNDGSHDLSHASRVAKNVSRILPENHEYCMCAIVCAWLHDVCDKKYVNTDDAIRSISRACRRRKFSEFELLENVLKNISYTKLRVHGPPQFDDNKTFQVWNIVAQADMIEALGVIGVIRTLMYQGSVDNSIKEAILYCKQNLLQSVEFINISPNMKKESRKRHQHMKEWLTCYENSKNIQGLSSRIVCLGQMRKSFEAAIDCLRDDASAEVQYFYDKFLEEERF